MLENISTFIGILILGIGEVIFARLVLNEKIKVSKVGLVFIMLIAAFLCTVTNAYLNGVIKTFVGLIIYVFRFKILFKIEYSKSVLLTAVCIMTLIIPDSIETIFVTKVLNVDKLVYYNEIAGTIYSNFVVSFGLVIIGLLFRKKISKIINYKFGNSIKIFASIFLTTMCILIVFYNAFNDIEFNYNLIISILTMIIFAGILFSLIKQTVDYNNLNKRYENILEFMTNYEEEVEKQRVLRHETKNAFLTIKSKITDKMANKEIIKYIDNILQDDTKMNNEEYAKFKNLPPNGIKGLCYYKVQEAINKGIKVSTSISNRLSKTKLFKLNTKEMKDLAKLLGIYLDNAIEASTESKEKGIGLEVYSIKDSVKIIISNSYNHNADLSKVGNNKYSTKGKNRGHGLLLAKNIINSNNIFNLENEITAKLFIQKITINNK